MLRNMSVLALIGMLTDAHPLQAASWTTLPALPQARFGAAAAAGPDGRLFVVGGFSDLGALSNATVWDPAIMGWSESAPMSMPRLFLAAASIHGSVLALGGFVDGMPTAQCERFASGSWTAIASMPVARASFGAGVIGDALYVAGGQGDDSSNLSACFRFDSTAGWTPIAPLPTPRAGVAAAVLEGKLWVIGGMDVQPLASVETFDPTSGQWSPGASLPEPLWFAAAASFEGRVWVAGGMDASFQRSDRVYSAGTDGVWRSEIALPAPLAVSAMSTVSSTTSSCLVMAGGMDAAGMPSTLAFSQCAEVAPPPPPPTDTLQVAVTLTPSTLNTGSNGNWIGADLMPVGWSAREIVVASLYLNGVGVDLGGSSTADDSKLAVKFPRAPFTTLPSGLHLLTVRGQRSDGRSFTSQSELIVKGTLLQLKGPRSALRPLANSLRSGIVIQLDEPADVRLEVIDLQGRVVDRLWQGRMAAGEYTQSWPRPGAAVARGVYFMRLQRPTGTDVARLLVIR